MGSGRDSELERSRAVRLAVLQGLRMPATNGFGLAGRTYESKHEHSQRPLAHMAAPMQASETEVGLEFLETRLN